MDDIEPTSYPATTLLATYIRYDTLALTLDMVSG